VFGRKGLDVKTADQIRTMRLAGMVVGETLELIRGQAVAGMTTADLDRTAEAFIRTSGATPSFLGYHGFTGSLCVSVNEEVVCQDLGPCATATSCRSTVALSWTAGMATRRSR